MRLRDRPELIPIVFVLLLCAAVPMGVALAVPRSEVFTREVLLSAALLALGAAAVLLGLALQWRARALRYITAVARRIASGHLDARARARGRGELPVLGDALDHLANNLSASIHGLQSERDLLNSVMQGMNEGVLLLDSAGHISLVNPALREMLLLTGDVRGLTLLQTIRHAELKTLLDRVRASGRELSEEIEISGLKPRRVLVHAAPLAGDAPPLLAVFVDVTDLRRLETIRRDFVANVSHELRTPVAAVRSAAETLAGPARGDAEATPQFLDIITRNADRLHNLIEDLLDLSRIESPEFHLTLESVRVAPVAAACIEAFRAAAERKRVTLVSEVSAAIHVHADRRALEQVLTNLVDNAVKYCSDGAAVRVRAAQDDRGVHVSVEDQSPGIEPRHLTRLFERFYRVDPGRSREMGGTGLGLAIVKHLAEAMGGAVSVESEIGTGSIFRVTLPGAASPAV